MGWRNNLICDILCHVMGCSCSVAWFSIFILYLVWKVRRSHKNSKKENFGNYPQFAYALISFQDFQACSKFPLLIFMTSEYKLPIIDIFHWSIGYEWFFYESSVALLGVKVTSKKHCWVFSRVCYTNFLTREDT